MSTSSTSLMIDHRRDALRRIIASCQQHEPQRARLAAEALKRIEKGTYGICQTCHMLMPVGDTERIPERINCSRCQRANQPAAA